MDKFYKFFIAIFFQILPSEKSTIEIEEAQYIVDEYGIIRF
jgi:hypothetical protein